MVDEGSPVVQFAARTLCVAPWRWENPDGFRTCANLWVVIDGRGAWTGDGQTYPCAAGDVFVQRLWRRCLGTGEAKRPLDVLWANIGWRDARGRMVDLRANERLLPRLHRRVDDIVFVAALAQRLVTAFERGEQAIADHWLACVLAECERSAAGIDPGLAPAIAAVREQPERAWSVAGLAQGAGLAVDVFARRFRAATGASPRAFVMRARLDRAKILLRTSNLAIGAIAERLGFCDIYHFSRRFRSHVGCAPSAYRAGRDAADRG
ncbi:MAG TPA: helix-turn-helix transcriptional regulator [Planctomycetota bacterium]|nr:helix-turn-helix transcriptional regulator [Planctomycetota bacterium]